jgi:hypothetical protein
MLKGLAGTTLPLTPRIPIWKMLRHWHDKNFDNKEEAIEYMNYYNNQR